MAYSLDKNERIDSFTDILVNARTKHGHWNIYRILSPSRDEKKYWCILMTIRTAYWIQNI